MLGMSRVRAAPHWMALAVAICRCSQKLSLRTKCTLRYLMLFFHSISCSPRTIFGYLKDLLFVISKASVFSGAVFRHLLSNQRFALYRLSLILSFRILTSSAAHATSASSAKPMILVPTRRSMRRKSSYMTFQTSLKKHLSKEEQNCERHFTENVKRESTGCYTVKLPFRENKLMISGSYKIALWRFFIYVNGGG